MLGYDTDTVAAIWCAHYPPPGLTVLHSVVLASLTHSACSGSVLGARFGTGWIPMHRLLERERLETYAEALVTGTTAVLSEPLETSLRRTQLTPIWCCCGTAGREQDKRRPHELETLEELIEKEVKLTAWGRSVKRQNGLGKKKGAGAQGGEAEEEDKGEDNSGRGGRGKSSRGKKGRKGKKNKGRRDDEHY